MNMMYRSLLRIFSCDLAIDLGTANTLVYMAGKGVVLNEPSIVAVNRHTGEVIGCGNAAKEMVGRVPGDIVAIRPLREGVIADFRMAERMLHHFIQKAHRRRSLIHPRIVIGVPSESTEVEKRAVLDSTYRAKASEVHLVEQPVVAALGAGLPVTEPAGNMVVDIGGGTTEIAIVALSGIVYSRSLRVAGNHMDDAIMEYVKRKHSLLIGERTAERVKTEIGSAFPQAKPLTAEVRGRDLLLGLPKAITMTDSEIREALSDSLGAIIAAIRTALDHTPPELGGDISERGMILTGGGSLLKGIDDRIRQEVGFPVVLADEPLASAVLGTGKVMGDAKLLRKICVN
jgi:rod shape-determining protein MreB and related proteins